ncbi:NADP-dependent oxidoreductase [Pseudonocardia sp. RS010]|uniref:NADP-dependent oxidoreductase n=1 Tax=Pseudonocardia sp. RS010 TaxID=3385979 RepID=UPI0039A1E982
MLAVQFDTPGPAAEALLLNQVPDPTPGPGEVLVEFEASTINPADVKIRSGAIPPRVGSAPYTLGYDLVGRVVGHGEGAGRHPVGTRVVGMSALAISGRGTWSELVSLPEDSVAAAPEGVEPTVAATLPLAGLTAYQAILTLDMDPGAAVLVTGAAGAIGSFAVQILRGRGLTVQALVLDAGQAASLPAGTVDGVHIREAGDLQVDGVLDTVGADFSRLLREGGHYLSVVPGTLPPAESQTMAGKKAKVIVTRESGALLEDLTALVAKGALHLPEPRVFALTDVVQAHAEFDKQTGRRIVLAR